jgi:hypothetical protein
MNPHPVKQPNLTPHPEVPADRHASFNVIAMVRIAGETGPAP